MTNPEPAVTPDAVWDCRTGHHADVAAWLASALPGDVLHYHWGFLAGDVWHPGTQGGRALKAVAGLLLALSGDGRVHLIQARIGAGEFDYMAVRGARR